MADIQFQQTPIACNWSMLVSQTSETRKGAFCRKYLGQQNELEAFKNWNRISCLSTILSYNRSNDLNFGSISYFVTST